MQVCCASLMTSEALLTCSIVFAILALFWNRVDEEVALLAPWQVMTKGFRGASDTILLDYISPTIPVKLFRSLKSRHWAVFSAIGVTLLLKLIVS